MRYGYRKIRVLLNREGWDVGKYLMYRLCKEEGLMLKRMKLAGKRKAAGLREEKVKPTAPDEAWSMDFVADQLQARARFRSLTIADVYTREAVAIVVGQSLKGDDVVRTLNKMKLEHGVPKVWVVGQIKKDTTALDIIASSPWPLQEIESVLTQPDHIHGDLGEVAGGTIIADLPPHRSARALISACGSYLG